MLRVAYFVELTWLLVDMFSGYLQNHGILLFGNLTVSALVRVLVMFLFSAIIVRYSKVMRFPTLTLFLICLIWILGHGIATILGGKNDVLADLQFHMKLMLPVLLFGVLQVQMEHDSLDSHKVRRIVLLNGAILIFNLWLGFFGIGFGNYGESDSGELLGSKGFFYAGNEVSATLVAIFALVIFLYRDRLKQNLFLMSVVGIMFFFSSIMSMSKTSLLGFLMVMVFAVCNYLSLARKVRFGAIITVIVLAATPFWLPLLQVAIGRWEYFWELRADFFDFITSGRTGRVERYMSWLTSADTPLPWIFGAGQMHGDAASSFENDLLDLTMDSGLLGLLFYSIWGTWAASGLYAWMRHRRTEGAFTLYMVGIFLVLSIVAGHVMMSATLAPFITLLALTSSRYFPDIKPASFKRVPHP